MQRQKALLAICSATLVAALGWLVYKHYIRAGSKAFLLKPPPPRLSDFTLLDHTGVSQTLSRHAEARAVVIVTQSLDEPRAAETAAAMNAVFQQMRNENIAFFWINANADDTRARITTAARELNLAFPVLLDPSQVVTRDLGLRTVPEIVVAAPPEWNVVYRGGPGAAFTAALEHARATDKAAPFASPKPDLERDAASTPIAFTHARNLSFRRHIAPIFVQKCLSCHARESGVTLTNHAQIKAAAEAIRKQVVLERMPPFSADTSYGEYLNDGSLTPEQKRNLIDWIDLGAPLDGEDALATFMSSRERRRERRTPSEPIYSVGMPEPLPIPAGGDEDYLYTQLGGEIPRDMWISTLSLKTTQPEALRVANLYIVRKPLSKFLALARSTTLKDRCFDSAMYVMGAIEPESVTDPNFVRMPLGGKAQPFHVPRENVALFLPKGYHIILETHRRGNGQPSEEQTSVDFYGTTTPEDRKALHGGILRSHEFTIPAGVKRHLESTAPLRLRQDAYISAMMTHMHLRGHAMRLFEVKQDGSERIIASIPNFHQGMMSHAYLLPKEPIFLPRTSRLKAVCEFDNSRANVAISDPYNPVRIGLTKSGTEMCNVSVQYYFE